MNTSGIAALFAFATFLGASMIAGAHDEAYFDSRESAHGGQTRMAGPYHLELVARDREIVLYVMDHADQDLSIHGGRGKATVQAARGKDKTHIKLEPAGDNMFKGTGDFAVMPGTVVAVFLELPGQEATTARFTPLQARARTARKANTPKPQAGGKGEDHHHLPM
jgi:hypothetical protein